MFNQVLAQFFLLIVTVTLSILTMIYGWGLHPQSWWWILGVGIGGQTAVQIILEITKKGKL